MKEGKNPCIPEREEETTIYVVAMQKWEGVKGSKRLNIVLTIRAVTNSDIVHR